MTGRHRVVKSDGDDGRDAERYRLGQAEDLLRAAGAVQGPEGAWQLPDAVQGQPNNVTDETSGGAR